MRILDKKDKIQSIVNVFETGKIAGDYANISIFKDGPNGARQVTYGKSQTTEYGNLKFLVESYVNNKGTKSNDLSSYVSKIGKTPLVDDQHFIWLLKEAGKDPVMVKTQDTFFDKHYWTPAIDWCNVNGMTKPLAGLIVYDSYIHSGRILSFLRNKFAEKVPKLGGSEEKWCEDYLKVRKIWLENHTVPILRKTVYRVNNLLDAVKNDNWNLDLPFNANGTIVK
jgi:chitosanase